MTCFKFAFASFLSILLIIQAILLGNSATLPIWHFAHFIVEILWTISVESTCRTQGDRNHALPLNFWKGGNA